MAYDSTYIIFSRYSVGNKEKRTKSSPDLRSTGRDVDVDNAAVGALGPNERNNIHVIDYS